MSFLPNVSFLSGRPAVSGERKLLLSGMPLRQDRPRVLFPCAVCSIAAHSDAVNSVDISNVLFKIPVFVRYAKLVIFHRKHSIYATKIEDCRKFWQDWGLCAVRLGRLCVPVDRMAGELNDVVFVFTPSQTSWTVVSCPRRQCCFSCPRLKCFSLRAGHVLECCFFRSGDIAIRA